MKKWINIYLTSDGQFLAKGQNLHETKEKALECAGAGCFDTVEIEFEPPKRKVKKKVWFNIYQNMLNDDSLWAYGYFNEERADKARSENNFLKREDIGEDEN